MTARDDYPCLAELEHPNPLPLGYIPEARQALDEIDNLRAELAALYHHERGVDP